MSLAFLSTVPSYGWTARTPFEKPASSVAHACIRQLLALICADQVCECESVNIIGTPSGFL